MQGAAGPRLWFGREDVTAEATCVGVCTFDVHDFGGHLWLNVDVGRASQRLSLEIKYEFADGLRSPRLKATLQGPKLADSIAVRILYLQREEQVLCGLIWIRVEKSADFRPFGFKWILTRASPNMCRRHTIHSSTYDHTAGHSDFAPGTYSAV